MPDRRIQLVIRLHDRKAWAWNIRRVAKRGDKAAGKRRLANPKRSRKRDHVAGSGDGCKPGAKLYRRFLILQDHRDPRGMVRITVVPFPFLDSSSTVPPWASMNWRVSGNPRPSAASPRKPA